MRTQPKNESGMLPSLADLLFPTGREELERTKHLAARDEAGQFDPLTKEEERVDYYMKTERGD